MGGCPAQLALGHVIYTVVPKNGTAVLYLQAAAESAAKRSKNEDMSMLLICPTFTTHKWWYHDDVPGNAMEVEQDGLDDDIIQYLNYAARNGDDKAQHSLVKSTILDPWKGTL